MRYYVRHVARLLNRDRDTVRKYESTGMLPPARRDKVSGYRYWLDDDLAGVREKFGVPEESKEMEVA